VVAPLGHVAILVGALFLLADIASPLASAWLCHDGDVGVEADPDAAAVPYARATEQDPDDARAWGRLGSALRLTACRTTDQEVRRRSLEQARQALERARDLTPADPVPHANLARLLGEMAYLGLLPPAPAQAEWDAALAADPDNALYLSEASRTALAVGDLPRARRLLAPGLARCPGCAPLLARQGACAFAEGDFLSAADALEAALAADWRGDVEEQARTAAALAAVRLARGEHERALLSAERAAALLPSWPVPLTLRARICQARGDTVQAARWYAEALRLDPTDEGARQALERLQGVSLQP
jgi:tetratricopeptide (TPR) repeat protein